MKKNKLFIYVIILSIFLLGFSSAEESIGNASFVISVHNSTIQITSADYSGNNVNYTVNISNNSITPQTFNFNFVFLKNTTISSDMLTKYLECVSLKSACDLERNSFNNAWSECKRNLDGLNGTQEKYNQCFQDLTQANSDKNLLTQEKEKLTTEKQETQNRMWLFGIGGIIIGVCGLLIKQGKFPKKQVPSAKEEFNRELTR
jgi:hypothetical protein